MDNCEGEIYKIDVVQKLHKVCILRPRHKFFIEIYSIMCMRQQLKKDPDRCCQPVRRGPELVKFFIRTNLEGLANTFACYSLRCISWNANRQSLYPVLAPHTLTPWRQLRASKAWGKPAASATLLKISFTDSMTLVVCPGGSVDRACRQTFHFICTLSWSRASLAQKFATAWLPRIRKLQN